MLADGKELPESIRQRPSALRKSIQYVFQNPYASLNPRRTIAESVARPLSLFFELSPNEVSQRVVEALQRVSLPRRVLDHYPDQLSGGERQRVAIARALAAEPSLLICDEVTSSLDVSVQASIVELLTSLRAEMNLAMLFVTHNLILARNIADRIAVMNKGRIVELSPPDSLFTAPRDEYTRQLLSDVVGMRTAA
jgi:peptide/nickel transport system ATP-binding protein